MKSPTYTIRAKGPLAIFTRPEFKSERFSYPCITPSACRGLIESILWKPAILWKVEKIHILNEINWTSFRRNEVGSKASEPSKTTVKSGGKTNHIIADQDRVMRNTVALKDVSYVIEAHFIMTNKAGKGDNITKFHEMFTRRMRKGQHFQQPYFGCRECPAEIELLDQVPTPIDLTKDLGIMLWDIDYENLVTDDRYNPIFFQANLEAGSLEIPLSKEEANQNLINHTMKSSC